MSADCVEKKKAAAADRSAEANELVRIDTGKALTLADAREQLERAKGPQYWRSLHELAQTPGFRRLIEDEFPRHAAALDEVSRRDFMKVAAAGLALAGLSACTKQPKEAIIPFVRQPENMLPGNPTYFATAMPFPTGAFPLLAKSNEGRPTKVEGNPNHPASAGGSDVFAQASVLGLYDPDRSQTIQHLGEVKPWGAFLGAIRQPLVAQKSLGGVGVRFLTETVISPTMAAQMRDLLKLYPQAKWYQYDPVNRDSFRAGMVAAFGQPMNAVYHIEPADVIVSLDADFLSAGYPGFHRYAREFASRRKVQKDGRGKSERGMNRLYAIESTPSSTGSKADHRLPKRASDVEDFARGLASALGASAGSAAGGVDGKFIAAMAKDLQAHRGASLVIAGEGQPAAVHALAAAMNQALGNVGKTVVYTDPMEANPVDQAQSLGELIGEMWAGKVDMLAIVGGNPVYNAPADLDFTGAMQKVPLRAHLGLYVDETSWLCHWHVPQAHYLESWSDTRAYDGTVSIVQPLIAPLYDGKSTHDFLTAFSDSPGVPGYDVLRTHWKSQHSGADFEMWWRKSLHDGFIADSALPEKQVTAKGVGAPGVAAGVTPKNQFEVIFRADPNVFDGRFANNGWLQELPKPLTKITWENAVLMSPTTARRLNLATDSLAAYEDSDGRADFVPGVNEGKTQVVTVRYGGREITGPVWVLPGHPDDSVTVHLGYGRERAGRVANGMGFSAYKLRTSNAPGFGVGAEVKALEERTQLAVTQHHQTMAGRDLVRAADLAAYEHDPKALHEGEETPDISMYPAVKYEGYAWGMTIDVNSCVGCNACVVACDAENNIAVVGKEQVIKEREMHWLRVDTYYEGTAENPRAYFQPVPCMHCEDAPCEPVCPVGATVHSSEGLNEMVYNRCVGTRYCSNNCPWKVRRFNFLLYQDWDTPQYKMLRNPDVTVRSRGVMEKCTYCVQRINRGRIDAETHERKVQDGDIETACQQACPADAIVFGNINDSAARVTALKQEARNYSLLGELNTRPRTTYLAVIRNPNPELESGGEKKGTARRK
ncbi:MAG: TAT-variant-translocated molybdopterin oxidoreductase [Acidobacteriota bacterium]|nr:TAT-variant-translocated molybdopterin oxidoreductase [Acidobacteriota bacterium]